jgi:hypothetical protein
MYTTTTNEREREFTGTRYTREPQRTKKILKQKKKKKILRVALLFCAFFSSSFSKNAQNTHTIKTTKKYI